MLNSLKAHSELRRKAGEIYGAVVTQARQPSFYAALGVPDTPSGRYEMVVLHLFIVLERLRGQGVNDDAPLPRSLVEAFVTDMDDSLRELGTGDLSVPKKVRRAATGLYERTMAYRIALAAPDDGPLLGVLAEHVYGGQHPAAPALARYLRAAAGVREGAGAEAIFPPVEGFSGDAS